MNVAAPDDSGMMFIALANYDLQLLVVCAIISAGISESSIQHGRRQYQLQSKEAGREIINFHHGASLLFKGLPKEGMVGPDQRDSDNVLLLSP